MRSLCSHLLRLTAVAVALLVVPATASATWYGSTLKRGANATYGCGSAIVFGAIGGFSLTPTHQSSCTYVHNGYLFRNRPTFLVPATGRITRIKVRAGRNPAKLRLTILSSSSRVDTTTGQDLPGTYTCCTARYVGKAFRPRANAVTTRRVNVRVFNVRSKRRQIRIHSSDGVAISAVSRGRVPLHVYSDQLGGTNAGVPLATGFWPRTKLGDPRVDGYRVSGIDVLLAWNFKRG